MISPHLPSAPMASRRTGLLADFKAFINKGNVVDLAVAVVIGGWRCSVTALT